MAELADAADSKSAGTWYLAGSIPVPGTIIFTGVFPLSTFAQQHSEMTRLGPF
jgi:hypothetical protein